MYHYSGSLHIVCEKQEGELQLKETNWICENCARITHEQGIERDTYTLLHLIP
ncbi:MULTISPECIES: hypothetical protein [Bacillus]|uniref:hypothetical protein n=1 Tax=Bacillus TaxID=1386 RepID=UPI000B173948|nr:hypothetical protein [Bacillus wiedmannii]MCU5514444.1 hypothetical protein [Bacillus wiedmannii]MCU5705692.1 hypothetical protein [Bacillus wiedmannii]HDX9653769.1 hypothetical protein [Bacillus wiedmannii]